MLPEAELTKLIAASREISLSKNQLLFTRGDAAQAVFILLDGELAIETMSEEGRLVRVATLQDKQIIGELAVLNNIPRTADARATRASKLLRIDGSVFFGVTTKNADCATAIIRDLIAKLCITNDQIENIALRPLQVRLAMALKELAENAPEGERFISITQIALAQRLSATREKVNIHLQSIQRTGAITIHRGRIEFNCLDTLNRLADQNAN